MTRIRQRAFAIGSAIAASAALLVATAFEAPAQGPAQRTLTILAVACPPGYVGNATAYECADAPMPGVVFRAGRPLTDFFLTAPTDAAGLVTFDITDLPLDGTIRVIEEVPDRTARIVVSCVDQPGAPLPITYVPMHGNVPPIMVADIAAGETGNVACDWYNVRLG